MPLLRTDLAERIINREFLDNSIEFFLILIVVLVVLIYYFLYLKKRRYNLRTSVQKSFELWLSKTILELYDNDEEANTDFHVPEKFYKHFRDPIKREYAMTELVNSKKNLTGSAAENIVKLYEQLGFKKYSEKKFKSNVWYVRAQGIQELYVMEQSDMLKRFFRVTNSANEYVRMEAQTGVIHFAGFQGLKFLEQLTYPITEWQQIKLLEQLRSKNMIELKRLPKWLGSSNDSVVLFALKLTDEFQQYHVHAEVVECLQHASEKIRYNAVRSLSRIANEETPAVLTRQYGKENMRNKLLILQLLRNMSGNEEIPFYLRALDEEDDTLKLNAARGLITVGSDGVDILQQRAKLQPFPYEPIFLHVKAEAGL